MADGPVVSAEVGEAVVGRAGTRVNPCEGAVAMAVTERCLNSSASKPTAASAAASFTLAEKSAVPF